MVDCIGHLFTPIERSLTYDRPALFPGVPRAVWPLTSVANLTIAIKPELRDGVYWTKVLVDTLVSHIIFGSADDREAHFAEPQRVMMVKHPDQGADFPFVNARKRGTVPISAGATYLSGYTFRLCW